MEKIKTALKERILKSLEKGAEFLTKNFMEASLFVERVDHQTVSERMQNPRMVRLLHGSVGMCTEAAEFQDALKKHLFYGKPLDEVNLIEELGDALWYQAIICDELGVTFEEVMQKNSKKLMHRYKDGFSETQALGRDTEKEREILES